MNKNQLKIIKKLIKLALGAILEGYGSHLGPKRAPRAEKVAKNWFVGPPGPPPWGSKIEPHGEVWGHVGAILASCWAPKGYQNDMNFLNSFWTSFLSIWGWFWEDFGSQNPSKIDQKSMHMAQKLTSNFNVDLTFIFYRFLYNLYWFVMDSLSLRTSKMYKKP